MELEGDVARVFGCMEVELRAGIWVQKGAGGLLTGQVTLRAGTAAPERSQPAGNRDRATMARSGMHSNPAWVFSFLKLNKFCLNMLVIKMLNHSKYIQIHTLSDPFL